MSNPVPDMSAAEWARQSDELRRAGREQEALAAAAEALKRDPARADMWGSIGFMLLKRGRWMEAAHYLKQAVALAPDDAALRGHYAIALAELDDYAGAYREANGALQKQPAGADANYLMGEILCRAGHYDRAVDYYKKARESGKLQRAATFGEGFARFMMGDLEAGAECLARADPVQNDLPLPAWDGSPDPDLHLVLCGEHGFGDLMQYARYVSALRKRIGRIMLSLPYALVGLMRDSFPDIAIHAYHVPEGARLPPGVSPDLPRDAKACSYAALPHLMGAPFDAQSETVPYLRADPARVAAWAERLKTVSRPRIGLVWSGNPLNQNNHNRSVPFAELQPLIELARPHLVSLQRDGSKEAQDAGIFDAAPFLDDFAESAAAVENCDLVITVCSAPAHLAGGMGRPVWTMLAFAPDWRWLIAREDSIWYPHMRLFRAPQPKAWPDVVGRLCADVQRFLGGDTGVLKPAPWPGAPLRSHRHAVILDR